KTVNNSYNIARMFGSYQTRKQLCSIFKAFNARSVLLHEVNSVKARSPILREQEYSYIERPMPRHPTIRPQGHSTEQYPIGDSDGNYRSADPVNFNDELASET
ncbi:hypothetical protein PV327_001552, partial [Microctonus hyperodae]